MKKAMLIIIILLVVALIALTQTSFQIEKKVVIDAPQDVVWKAVVDMESYHKWNSQLEFLGGTPKEGEVVRLKLSVDGADPYEFSPTINHWEANERFGWIARTGVPYIFDGEHFFELEEQNSQTLLTNREVYSGLLSLLIKQQPMMKNAPSGFVKMNSELKNYIENRTQ